MAHDDPKKDGDVYTPDRGSDVDTDPQRDWKFPNQPNREIGRDKDREIGRPGREGGNPSRKPGR